MYFFKRTPLTLLACIPFVWLSNIPFGGNQLSPPVDPQSSDSANIQSEKNLLLFQNVLPFPNFSDDEIITKMAEYKFEYFEVVLKHLTKGTMTFSLRECEFTQKDLYLIWDTMDGTKTSWTKAELI